MIPPLVAFLATDRLQFDRLLDGRGHWDAMAFVDLCQMCGRDWGARTQAAAELQTIELRLLLEYTCRAAQGVLQSEVAFSRQYRVPGTEY